MGCYVSIPHNSELLRHCKERRHLMKQAVIYMENFSLAHSTYLNALKRIGAALHNFATIEDDEDKHASEDRRLSVVKNELDTEDQSNEENELEVVNVVSTEQRNLREAVVLIGEQFDLVSTATGIKISSLTLETQRAHHQSTISNFKDYFEVLKRSITFHNSSPNETQHLLLEDVIDEGSSSDAEEFDMGISHHASTLDKLYAWEKRQYKEVKNLERTRLEFDKKREQIRIQYAKRDDEESMGKIKDSLQNLDSKQVVGLHTIHYVSQRIQRVTNEEFYPQLVEIVRELTKMWRIMQECYITQNRIALEMNASEKSNEWQEELRLTQKRKATMELQYELNNWLKCHNWWINAQFNYIQALFKWLCQLYASSKTERKGENIGSKRRRKKKKKKKKMPSYMLKNFPICRLIAEWQDTMQRLSRREEDSVDTAICIFLRLLRFLQAEEARKQRLELEGMSKQFEGGGISLFHNTGKGKNDEDKNKSVALCKLKSNLPHIFELMADFASVALVEYDRLQQVSLE